MKWLILASVGLLGLILLVPASTAGDYCPTPLPVTPTGPAAYSPGQIVAPSSPYGYPTQVLFFPVSPYFFSVGDAYREQRITEGVLQRLGAPPGQAGYSQGQPPASNGATSPQASAPSERDMFRLVGGQTSSPAAPQPQARDSSLNSQALQIFNSSCVQCHKPGTSKPGVALLTSNRGLYLDGDSKKEASRRARVYASVESGEMPKGGGPLPAEQKDILRRWSEELTQK